MNVGDKLRLKLVCRCSSDGTRNLCDRRLREAKKPLALLARELAREYCVAGVEHVRGDDES